VEVNRPRSQCAGRCFAAICPSVRRVPMLGRAGRPVPGHPFRDSRHAAYPATRPPLVALGAILLTFLAEAKVSVDACMIEVGGMKWLFGSRLFCR
jgi:hypothetical protein